MELQELDIHTLEQKGKSIEQLKDELEMLKSGFPFLKIESAATIGKGISVFNDEEKEEYKKIWNAYLAEGGKVVKMVPASGAASRMFKDLFTFANGDSNTPNNDFISSFFNGIEKFAFFNLLNKKCMEKYSKSVSTLMNEGRHRDIVRTYPKRWSKLWFSSQSTA